VLTVEYPWVVWYGPEVGQPTQVIRGHDFQAHETVEIQVLAPPDGDGDPGVCDQQTTSTVQADAAGDIVLDTVEAGDPYFGTQCRGDWQAQASGQATGLQTNIVTWTVSWFPARRER
jgi:hypothetical protein